MTLKSEILSFLNRSYVKKKLKRQILFCFLSLLGHLVVRLISFFFQKRISNDLMLKYSDTSVVDHNWS